MISANPPNLKSTRKKKRSAELQRQQQHFVAQKLLSAQKHVAVTHPPQPQQATIVYRVTQQPVTVQQQSVPLEYQQKGEVRHRSRTGRHHDGRYTSGKFCFEFLIILLSMKA